MQQYEPMYDSYAQHDEHYVPTKRIGVAPGVFLPSGNVDLSTGYLKPDRQRRCRTQGKILEMETLEKEEKELRQAIEKENAKGGARISVRAGVLIVAVLCFVCGIFLLIQQGNIAECQKKINRLQRNIAECEGQNAAIEAQIAEASDASAICYAAAQDLHMIRAEAADAIHLVALDTRPLEKKAEPDTVKAEKEDDLAESTHVPTVASN